MNLWPEVRRTPRVSPRPRQPSGRRRFRSPGQRVGFRLLGLSLFVFSLVPARLEAGEIRGRVVDARTGLPLPGSNVTIVGTQLGAAAGEDGRFSIPRVPEGIYELRVSRIGYRARLVRGVRVSTGGEPVTLDLRLQPSAIEVDPIVVSASKREQLVQESPVSVSVVTGEEIRRRSPLDLAQAIEMAPGVHFVGNQVNVRGSTGFNLGAGNKVLLLLDGVPVYASDTGEFNWDLIPPDEVERVEILKGAGSALWGAAALGGVVNILTRPPSSDRWAIGITTGKYDRPAYPQWIWTDWDRLHYERVYVSATKRIGAFSVRAALGRSWDTGYRQLGDSRKLTSTVYLLYQLRNGGRLVGYVAYNRIRRGFFIQWRGQNHPYEVDPAELNNRAQVDQLYAYAKLTLPLSPKLAVSGRLSTVRTLMGSYLSRPSDFRPALGQGAEVQVDWLPRPRHSLTLGVQLQQDGGSARYFGQHTGVFLAPYAQDEISIGGGLRTTFGLRYDAYRLDSRRREDLLSPRLGLSWQVGSWAVLRASAGSGFRAATIVERFLEVQVQNFTVRPNPELEPERCWTYEVGGRLYPAADWVLDWSLFRSDYRQLIEAHLDLIRGFIQFRNFPRARIQGIELSSELSRQFRILAFHWTAAWRFSLTAIHHEELEFHDPLPYRPKQLANCQWLLRAGALEAQLDFRYASRLDRVKVYPIADRVPMKFWDAHVGIALGDARLQLACRNLTNYNYGAMESNLDPPRRFELTLQWSP